MKMNQFIYLTYSKQNNFLLNKHNENLCFPNPHYLDLIPSFQSSVWLYYYDASNYNPIKLFPCTQAGFLSLLLLVLKRYLYFYTLRTSITNFYKISFSDRTYNFFCLTLHFVSLSAYHRYAFWVNYLIILSWLKSLITSSQFSVQLSLPFILD